VTAKFGLLINANVKGENNIKRLGNSMQGVQGKVKNLKMAVGGLNTAFKALSAALVVGGFTRFIQGSIDAADALGKLSTRTGIAADTLQGYVNAGKLADVSQKQLETGLKTLARTQFEASQGVKTYAEAYSALGVSVKSADGSLKGSDVLLGELADKFKDLPNGPEKAAVAMRLFGKSGADMITLLNGGSEGLEEFNYNLSEEFAPRAELFNDTLTKIGFQFEGFRMQLMDQLLPALQVIAESFATLFDSENDWTSLFMVIEGGIRGVAIVLMSIIKLFDRIIKSAVSSAKILKRVFTFDFKGALDEAGRYYQQFGQQLGEDKALFDRLAFGRAAAPTQRQGTGLFTMPDRTQAGGGKQPKTPEQKAAEDYEKMLQKLIGKAEEFRIVNIEAIEVTKQQATAFDGVKDAAAGYLESIGTMREGITNLTGTAFKGLEDALTSLVTTGKANFVDFARTILAATARMIIQQTILRSLMQAIGAIGGGGSTSITGGTGIDGDAFGAAAFSKVLPTGFAKGGIFDKPKMFAYANGGVGRFGILGEAGPEAIMPLKRGPGGRLGVEASAGVGNIVVNVDASDSQAQGDTARSKQLGEAIGVAIRQELIKQKRPGGLLA
jgi:hypothetical protein